MLHYFTEKAEGLALPLRFTYPFNYIPHELCRLAASEVKQYIQTREDWVKELEAGKMFGVLIVSDREGKTGFLAAYSGLLGHPNSYDYFVPPVFDLLAPGGYFKEEEARISDINRRIREVEQDEDFLRKREQAAQLKQDAALQIKEAKEDIRISKLARELKRKTGATAEEEALLIRESQFQKAELKRLERALNLAVADAENELLPFTEAIQRMKDERKSRSAALQKWLFDQFEMLNACGEKRTLSDIFAETPQLVPPAGAGECAGPKLMQYAYRNGLKPLAMAEFWWGASPKTELRIHENYYPACKGKCEPILKHMMIGLQVDPDPLTLNPEVVHSPEIIYEDEWLLVVNKPEGLLSVPGKLNAGSVYSWAHDKYPDATGPMIVHRLDMATSGLLLIAKTKEVHQILQAKFKSRDIKKKYIALLEGELTSAEGSIDLPLCLNPDDRPRQMVSYEYGKPALTYYQVLSTEKGKTRIAFFPLTGRTHQLRVHAAHVDGLNCPISGDALYGTPDKRLYLHAERLELEHPVTGEWLVLEASAPF